MAAGTWKVYTQSKRNIGSGLITLGAGIFRMALHRASASAIIKSVVNGGISTWGSIPGEISARGGYVVGGRTIGPATGQWTVGSSTLAMRFTYTTAGLVFTASGSALNNIKYAVIRNSTGAGAGRCLAFVTLSTSPFTIAIGNTLTITPATNGIFQLS